MRSVKIPFWQLVVGLILSWIGLAGFIDELVVWHDWFEKGVMQHWRAIKLFLIENVFFWLPFRIPEQFFDYLALGAIFGRSYYVFAKKFMENASNKVNEFIEFAKNEVQNEQRQKVAQYFYYKSNKDKFTSLRMNQTNFEAMEKSGSNLERANLLELKESNVREVDFSIIQRFLGLTDASVSREIKVTSKILVERSDADYQFKFFFRTSQDRLLIALFFVFAWPLSLILSLAIRIIRFVANKEDMRYFNGQIIGYDKGDGFRGFGSLTKFFILSAIVLGELIDEVVYIFALTALTFVPIVFIASKSIYRFFPSLSF